MYDEKLITAAALLIIAAMAIGLGLCFLHAIAYSVIFRKAGYSWWKAWIPVYSRYTRFHFTWEDKWFFISLAVSIVTGLMIRKGGNTIALIGLVLSMANLGIYIVEALRLAEAFGKGTGFAIGLIILPTIFLFILAFGKSEYVKPDCMKNDEAKPENEAETEDAVQEEDGETDIEICVPQKQEEDEAEQEQEEPEEAHDEDPASDSGEDADSEPEEDAWQTGSAW